MRVICGRGVSAVPSHRMRGIIISRAEVRKHARDAPARPGPTMRTSVFMVGRSSGVRSRTLSSIVAVCGGHIDAFYLQELNYDSVDVHQDQHRGRKLMTD